MKTTIKIHDTEWFEEHCTVCTRDLWFEFLKPKSEVWRYVSTVHWLHGRETSMNPLVGKVLEVEHDNGPRAGNMSDACYMAAGFWIPNWAIEWVKEEQA